MKVDLEFESWQALWRTDVQVPADLREKADRQLRRMRMMLIADIGATIVMGGAVIAWAVISKETQVRLLAAWVWMTLLIAWLFRWFNDRGNWTGAAPNTEAFLELLQKRYRASLRNMKFGYVLGIVQLVFSSAWVYSELNRSVHITIWQFVTLKVSLAAWICVALLFGATMLFSRKLRRELACVERLRNEWTRDGVPATLDGIRGQKVWLNREIATFLSLLEGLDWTRRRKKKIWKI